MVVPPDGGFAWLIVVASFFCNFVVDGIMFSYGIFLTPLSDYLNITAAQVLLIGSVQSGMYLLGSPIISAICNRYGFRIVAISGAIFSSLGISKK